MKAKICALTYMLVLLCFFATAGYSCLVVLDYITTTPIERDLRYVERVQNNIAIIATVEGNNHKKAATIK